MTYLALLVVDHGGHVHIADVGVVREVICERAVVRREEAQWKCVGR